METLNLIINTATNKALNPDGITALRAIHLVQGESYKVNLKFVGGGVPAIDAFAFYLRKTNSSANLVSVTAATSQGGEYPYYFILSAASPALAAALAGDSTPFNAFLSWTEGAEIELIEVFTANVVRASSDSGEPAGYVATLNSLIGDITLTGAGSVSVIPSGQFVTIYGAATAATGNYYPSSNPSGYINAIPPDVVRTTGVQNINGTKSFETVIVNSFLWANFVTDLGGAPAIDVTNRNLLGNWKQNGVGFTRSFSETRTLTKITPEIPAYPASAYFGFVNYNSLPGATISITVNGVTQVYQFDVANPDNGHYWIDCSPFGSVDNAASAMCLAISATFGSAVVNVSSPGGGVVTFEAATQGSSSTLSWSASTSDISPDTASSSGGEPIEESGTRQAVFSSDTPESHVTAVFVHTYPGVAWATAEIAIGYLLEDTTFIPLYIIPQSSLTAVADGYLEDLPLVGGAFQYLAHPPANAALIGRTISPGSYNIPADETAGAEVEILVQGFTR